MSSPFLTEPVALWEYLSLHTQTQECRKQWRIQNLALERDKNIFDRFSLDFDLFN